MHKNLKIKTKCFNIVSSTYNTSTNDSIHVRFRMHACTCTIFIETCRCTRYLCRRACRNECWQSMLEQFANAAQISKRAKLNLQRNEITNFMDFIWGKICVSNWASDCHTLINAYIQIHTYEGSPIVIKLTKEKGKFWKNGVLFLNNLFLDKLEPAILYIL